MLPSWLFMLLCIDMLTEMKRSAAALRAGQKRVTKRRLASRLEEQRKHTCEKALSQLPRTHVTLRLTNRRQTHTSTLLMAALYHKPNKM